MRKIYKSELWNEMQESGYYYISKLQMKKFEAKFKNMIKLANEAGLVAPTYNVIEKVKVLVSNSLHKNQYFYCDFNVVEINCPDTIKLPGGWFLIGTIDHRENMVRSVPGQEIPKKYWESDNYCDHCKTNRYRRDTFVIQNEADEYMKVGRQCIQKFLGINGVALAKVYTGFFNMMENYQSEENFNNFDTASLDYGYNLKSFIEMTVCVVRNEGWLSKGKALEADKLATVDLVEIYEHAFQDSKYIWTPGEQEAFTPTDKDKANAMKVIEYVKNIKPDNDYEFNLNKIALGMFVSSKYTGYAASMVAYYHRVTTKKVANQAKPNSKHIGEVKVRQEFYNLKIVDSKLLNTDYGVTTLLKFKDPVGNELIWFASGHPSYNKSDGSIHYYNECIGKIFNFKATVKSHSEFNGVKQTIINRAILIK